MASSSSQFLNNERKNIFSIIYQVINEFELIQYVYVTVKIIQVGKVKKTVNNLSLQEYHVTDDGETAITIAMFKDFLNLIEMNGVNKIITLQLVTYRNERKRRRTSFTKLNCVNLVMVPEAQNFKIKKKSTQRYNLNHHV